MRQLLNTLYIFSDDLYLSLDGENVVAKRSGKEISRIPLHTLEAIHTYSYAGASPALMGLCAERGISLCFFSPQGKFLAATQGAEIGNVLLRKAQFRISEEDEPRLMIARNFVLGKVYNSRWVLERTIRDHSLRIDVPRVKEVSQRLASSLREIRECESVDKLRGIEGAAASSYYSVFDEMILNTDPFFSFVRRSRRPPLNAVNAMLSLFYSVLSLDCASALCGVGLDAYVGFMHVDRPGRRSLALDLMEELRSVMVDRFVLNAINNRVVDKSCFMLRESGEVRLSDKGRRTLFDYWQKRKRETIKHPFTGEKLAWGLVPHIQAQLLAKCIRGDLDGYPPLLWK